MIENVTSSIEEEKTLRSKDNPKALIIIII